MEKFLQLTFTGLTNGSILALVALGFVLIYKATEMVNFAQGDLMMFGAFIAYTFLDILDWPFLWGILATLIVMAVLGMAIERLFMRRMIGEPPFAALMLTIGLGFLLRAVAGGIWGSEPRSITTPFGGGVFTFGDLVIGYENVAIVLGTVVLCTALFLFFRRTTLGIAMQAASQNQLAAYYVGISVKRIYMLVWAISALIAGAAGILVTPVSLVDPQLGFIGIKAFAAAIVGGFGSLPGAIVGGLIVGIAEQFAGLYLPPGFADTSAYVILLLVLLARPEGIFSTMQQKKV